MNLQASSVVKKSHDRIRNHSPKSFNNAIDRKAVLIMQTTIAQGPDAIRERLNVLDKEWNIDRASMLFSSGMVAALLATAIKKNNKNWLWIPLMQSSFLMLNATFGWSPSVPVLRKLGFRTRYEIQAEREELLSVLRIENEEEYDENILITDWDIYEST